MPEANRAHANFSAAERFFPAAAVLSMARSGALPASSPKPANRPQESAVSDNTAAGTHHSHMLDQAVPHSILKNVADAARPGLLRSGKMLKSATKVIIKTGKMIMKNCKVIMA
jgi:hypothetical protein